MTTILGIIQIPSARNSSIIHAHDDYNWKFFGDTRQEVLYREYRGGFIYQLTYVLGTYIVMTL